VCVEIKCSHSSRLPFRSNASIVGICPDRELSSDSWDSKKKQKNLKTREFVGFYGMQVWGLWKLSLSLSFCFAALSSSPHAGGEEGDAASSPKFCIFIVIIV